MNLAKIIGVTSVTVGLIILLSPFYFAYTTHWLALFGLIPSSYGAEAFIGIGLGIAEGLQEREEKYLEELK